MPDVPVPDVAIVNDPSGALNNRASRARTSSSSSTKSGSRWLSTGAAIARMTRGGITLGPGPSNTRSTAGNEGCCATISIPAFHQLGAPVCGIVEHRVNHFSSFEVGPHLRQAIDQQVERRANLVGVGDTDVTPHVSGTGGQPRGVDQPLPRHLQARRLGGP